MSQPRILVLWILSLTAFHPVCAQEPVDSESSSPLVSITDAYDTPPATDNSPETATVLLFGPEPQLHNLHDSADEDWFRIILPSRNPSGDPTAIPYSIELTDVSTGDGEAFLEIWRDEAPFPGDPAFQDTFVFQDTSFPIFTRGDAGVGEFWARLSTTIPPSDGAAISYSISITKSTGANNSIIASLGTVTSSRPNPKGSLEQVAVLRLDISQGSAISGTPIGEVDALRVNRRLLYIAANGMVIEESFSQIGSDFYPPLDCPCDLEVGSCDGNKGVPPLQCAYLLDPLDNLPSDFSSLIYAAYNAQAIMGDEVEIWADDTVSFVSEGCTVNIPECVYDLNSIPATPTAIPTATPTSPPPTTTPPPPTPTMSPTPTAVPTATPTPLPDTDGDGRPDVCESTDDTVLSQTGTSVTHMLLRDSDGDGLLDGEEFPEGCAFPTGSIADTNPRDFDSDNDGFLDGLEVLVMGTDPLDPNSPDREDIDFTDEDGDGLPRSLDPDDNNPDIDNDRYSDGFEVAHGTDPEDDSSKPSLADVNGNGVISTADVTIIKQFIQGLFPASGIPSNMDTTRNGRLTSGDVTRLKQYVGDLDRKIP